MPLARSSFCAASCQVAGRVGVKSWLRSEENVDQHTHSHSKRRRAAACSQPADQATKRVAWRGEAGEARRTEKVDDNQIESDWIVATM